MKVISSVEQVNFFLLKVFREIPNLINNASDDIVGRSSVLKKLKVMDTYVLLSLTSFTRASNEGLREAVAFELVVDEEDI